MIMLLFDFINRFQDTLNIITFQSYLLRIAHCGGEGNKCMGAHLPQDYCGRTFGGEYSSRGIVSCWPLQH